MKKVYKKVEQDNGTLTFYGGRKATLHFGYNKDLGENDYYFFHYGRKYWLSEFTICGWGGASIPEYMKEFSGYTNDSFFSGVAIKVDNTGETVKACTFIS